MFDKTIKLNRRKVHDVAVKTSPLHEHRHCKTRPILRLLFMCVTSNRQCGSAAPPRLSAKFPNEKGLIIHDAVRRIIPCSSLQSPQRVDILAGRANSFYSVLSLFLKNPVRNWSTANDVVDCSLNRSSCVNRINRERCWEFLRPVYKITLSIISYIFFAV